jgi:hypothetical protein
MLLGLFTGLASATNYPLHFWSIGWISNDYRSPGFCDSTNVSQYSSSTGGTDYGVASVCFNRSPNNHTAGIQITLHLPYNPVTGSGSIIVSCTNTSWNSTYGWEITGTGCRNSSGDYISGSLMIYTCNSATATVSGDSATWELCNGRGVVFSSGLGINTPAAAAPEQRSLRQEDWVFTDQR